NSSILVLDEPTAALDPIAENELYKKYSALTTGKTSVYISHRFASTRFCDRIVLLENGEICECGNHAELMEVNGRYAELFNVQSKYYKEGEIDE
ncbi:MAG: ABC transporter ATP-binding protein, partial [Clostridia bacterium]|nr:ABC transporter ATP-binding protein [Clostridia bacterium]